MILLHYLLLQAASNEHYISRESFNRFRLPNFSSSPFSSIEKRTWQSRSRTLQGSSLISWLRYGLFNRFRGNLTQRWNKTAANNPNNTKVDDNTVFSVCPRTMSTVRGPATSVTNVVSENGLLAGRAANRSYKSCTEGSCSDTAIKTSMSSCDGVFDKPGSNITSKSKHICAGGPADD